MLVLYLDTTNWYAYGKTTITLLQTYVGIVNVLKYLMIIFTTCCHRLKVSQKKSQHLWNETVICARFSINCLNIHKVMKEKTSVFGIEEIPFYQRYFIDIQIKSDLLLIN